MESAGRLDSRVRTAAVLLAGAALLAACDDDDPVPAQNRAPTAVATATPAEIPRDDGNTTIIALDGSTSSDPDGDPLTFAWTVPGGTFENGSDATMAMADVSFDATDNVEITLDVSDGNGGTAQAMVTVALENGAPMAVVAADPDSVPTGDGNTTIVTIDASDSTDPDDDPLSFDWTVPSGTFENGTTATDETIQVSFPGSAPYDVQVIVMDSFGAADTATVTVRIF